MRSGQVIQKQDALLRFGDGQLEREFRSALAVQGQPIRIAALAFAVLLILSMGALDPLFLPQDVLRAEMSIRYGVLAPIPILGILLIRNADKVGARYQVLMSILGLAVGVVFSVQLWVGGPSTSSYYFPAIIMGFLFGQFLLGLPFAYSLVVTGISVVLYSVVCLAVGAETPTVMYVSVMLSAIAGISTYGAYQFEHAIRTAFVTGRALGRERDQYDALLGQILPDSVRARLSAGEGNVAQAHAEVTVMFIDLVAFADLSRRLTAPHLVEVLDKVFKCLDELADLYGVERIKTIGDCYMCAAGLDGGDRGGAAVLDLALDAIPAIASIGVGEDLPLAVTIGIATGTAVSGVLGSKRPHFDLWGQTVNTASRMQVTGERDRIHVDERTRYRYQSRFEFESRGASRIRGVGEVETYFLLHRHAMEGAAAS